MSDNTSALLEGLAFALMIVAWCAMCMAISDYNWN